MFDEALRRLTEIDSFAAIEFLSAQDDTLAAVKVCDDLVRHLYNEAKNVPAMLMIGCAGIQLGLDRAAQETDSERAAAIKGQAKAIAYNIAANAWPGWEDEGITITTSDIACGLDAARTNLRLARELRRGDLPLSRAHWVIGALQLAVGELDAAKSAFEQAAQFARAAGEQAEALLSDGCAALVDVRRGGDDAALNAILAELATVEDGPFFAGQIEGARRLFGES
jgi:hypothetical protein